MSTECTKQPSVPDHPAWTHRLPTSSPSARSAPDGIALDSLAGAPTPVVHGAAVTETQRVEQMTARDARCVSSVVSTSSLARPPVYAPAARRRLRKDTQRAGPHGLIAPIPTLVSLRVQVSCREDVRMADSLISRTVGILGSALRLCTSVGGFGIDGYEDAEVYPSE